MNESIAWASDLRTVEQAGHFFAEVISSDPAYISHGEIQQALSLDGKSWAPDLDRRLTEELLKMGDAKNLLICRDAADAMLAAAIVTWDQSKPEAPFATIEDLAVLASHRSSGLGARIVSFIEAEARKRAMKWLFLESGKNNTRAHAFFERGGFKEVSHVFAKRL